jgi:hypothetical protein
MLAFPNRFVRWIGEGQNATVALVFITSWYAFLTHRMAKSAARQTRAMLQPALSFTFQKQRTAHEKGTAIITNVGSQPVVLLDVRIECSPMGRPLISKKYGMDGDIIALKQDATYQFDFSNDVPAEHLEVGACGYGFIVVASDLSREVVVTYKQFPILNTTLCRFGMPMAVRFRYAVAPLKVRYYRFMAWVKEMKKTMGPWDDM